MSTHCQLPSLGVLYGTRGTPMGIIRVTCRRGPPPPLLLLAITPRVRRQNSSEPLTADDDGSRAARQQAFDIDAAPFMQKSSSASGGAGMAATGVCAHRTPTEGCCTASSDHLLTGSRCKLGWSTVACARVCACTTCGESGGS